MNVFLKGSVIAISALVLAGCDTTPAGPRTVDSEGRAIAQAPEGVELFMKACYRPGGAQSALKRVIAADKNITAKPSVDTFIVASHALKSLSIISIGEGTCAVTFDAGVPAETAAKQAVAQLIPQIKPTGFGGKAGGGQVNIKTAKGSVVVTNNRKHNTHGATISLYKR